jgi:hypothetical protein
VFRGQEKDRWGRRFLCEKARNRLTVVRRGMDGRNRNDRARRLCPVSFTTEARRHPPTPVGLRRGKRRRGCAHLDSRLWLSERHEADPAAAANARNVLWGGVEGPKPFVFLASNRYVSFSRQASAQRHGHGHTAGALADWTKPLLRLPRRSIPSGSGVPAPNRTILERSVFPDPCRAPCRAPCRIHALAWLFPLA